MSDPPAQEHVGPSGNADVDDILRPKGALYARSYVAHELYLHGVKSVLLAYSEASTTRQ